MGGSNLNLGHAGPACKRRARGGRGVQSESGPAYGVIVIATDSPADSPSLNDFPAGQGSRGTDSLNCRNL